MVLVLKLPVVYLCAVVWYAIKAEPEPATGEGEATGDREPTPWTPWRHWSRVESRRPRRGGPHDSPRRGYARAARSAASQAEASSR